VSEPDKRLLQHLSTFKGPGDCPSIATLGAFEEGRLAEAEKEAVEKHLQACPSCVNQLIDLREFARLEREGPEPPPDLVERVKRFALRPGPETVGDSVMLARVREAVSQLWVTLTERRIPRFAAELAVVCATLLIVLRISGWTIARIPSARERSTSQVENFADLSPRERTLLTSLSHGTIGAPELDKRLVSALEKLPRTLLLEESRGATDVAIYKKAAPATLLVVTDKSLGSGVALDDAGHVVTNWHVIEDAKTIAVVLKPERGVALEKAPAYAALPEKVDQVADLALLKVSAPAKLVAFLPLANMATVEVGQDVHAIGHPDGEVWTYTTGVVSQIRPDYRWTGEDKLQHLGKVIQTQTAINPGNSGGPLLNDRGEIIGINSFRKEGEGLNYAVAADVVSEFLKRTESRSAAPVSPPAPTSYRVERYGRNIAGAYLRTAVPPPDLWLVYGESGKGNVKYSVMGRVEKTKLDTAIILREDKALVFYLDTDCDGTIDLIGYAEPGADSPSHYERPASPTRLGTLTAELSAALKDRAIPYRQVRICQ